MAIIKKFHLRRAYFCDLLNTINAKKVFGACTQFNILEYCRCVIAIYQFVNKSDLGFYLVRRSLWNGTGVVLEGDNSVLIVKAASERFTEYSISLVTVAHYFCTFRIIIETTHTAHPTLSQSVIYLFFNPPGKRMFVRCPATIYHKYLR